MKKAVFYVLAAFVLLAGIFIKFYTIGAGEITKITPAEKGVWPSMTGISLMGKEFTLPKDFEKPLNLVVVGFKRRHQDNINTWIEAFRQGDLGKLDIGFFEVPVIYEMEFTQRFFLNNAMKFGIQDEGQKQRTITVFLDRSQFLKTMNMEEEHIYAVFMDQNGNILWMRKGDYTKEFLEELLSIIKSRS